MKLTTSFSILLVLQVPSLVNAAPAGSDPCAAIAGKRFVVPSQAMACLKSFPYNETIKTNVMSNAERVMDFFSFEPFYKDSPPPFQESTVQIRAQFSRIKKTKYESDYAFNRDLFDVALSLNDGHTRWHPTCYLAFENLLPTPIISLLEGGQQNVYVSPDAVKFIGSFGEKFISFYEKLGFDWERLAGAKVEEVEGKSAYDYIDYLATTQVGNYLDHGVRVNSVFTGYFFKNSTFFRKLGHFASRDFPDQDYLTMRVTPVNSTKVEEVKVPFSAVYVGDPFTDKASYWQANCAVKNNTNGVNKLEQHSGIGGIKGRLHPIGVINQRSTRSSIVSLPRRDVPTIFRVAGNAGSIDSFILPDGKTGVIYVGDFYPDKSQFYQFQYDIESAVKTFISKGVTKLVIDLHNNDGGYLCLGHFLFKFLASKSIKYSGFEATIRANELAKKIVASNIKLGLNSSQTFFAPDNWTFLNGTLQPASYNYINPSASFNVNGISDPTSQRFGDSCSAKFVVDIPDKPIFKPENIALVGNGNCASTCALFSTLMYEGLNVKIATFGGRPGQHIEFKGTAGTQILSWPLLDSEIKTAGLKGDPLAPPDLIIDGDYQINWRTAWSLVKKEVPIAYLAEPPKFRFPYTNETYSHPLNLWIYAASQMFNSSSQSGHS